MKCNRCDTNKDVSQFRNHSGYKSGHESYCKTCMNFARTMRKYSISKNTLKYLYSHKQCMCCGERFINNKQRHIHHTVQGVQGLICTHCNTIIRQETEEDLQRIKDVLVYIKSPRKPVCLLNKLPNRIQHNNRLAIQCKNTNIGARYCTKCKKYYTLESFYTSNPRICCNCRREGRRLSYSRPVKESKKMVTNCDCCKSELKKKHIHHVGNIAYGIVCNRCNSLLKDESKTHTDRLLSCIHWINQDKYKILPT